MKRIFLSIVLLFLFQNGWSQCPALANSTLGFETQADIAAFKADYPNCTEIPGNLRIVGNNVTDLSDLSQITSIGGTLIVNSTGITNLTGLGNLTSVESGLQILGNQSMTSLTGLGNISDFWLRLSTNNALTSLTGLEHFTTVNTISVSENTSLASLSGLENITTITGLLDIALNTPVSTLAGLENLTYVNEIWLQHLHSLTDISAFANLTAISGRFYMYNCSSIANLDALSNVEQIGELVLFGNSSLTSLKGLAGLQEITDLVSVSYNSQLSECAIKAICDYISMDDAEVFIENNLGDCLDVEAVLAACAALPVTLISFSANEEAGQANLYWETTEETNSEYFEVQRSADAENWHTLGLILAKGNSQELNRYTFTDEYPVPSVNYYRLRSVDLDRSYSLSSMVSVTMAGQNQPLVYPVPAVNGVWIEGEKILNKKAELLNLRGEIMKTWEIASDRDYLDLGSLPAGSYLIRLESGAPLRLIKE